MKAQTNKCHTFSILLFDQPSLYMQRVRANVSILDKLRYNF